MDRVELSESVSFGSFYGLVSTIDGSGESRTVLDPSVDRRTGRKSVQGETTLAERFGPGLPKHITVILISSASSKVRVRVPI